MGARPVCVQVRGFVSSFLELECPLHYLVCNAGKMASPYRTTAQGFEAQWGAQPLSHAPPPKPLDDDHSAVWIGQV